MVMGQCEMIAPLLAWREQDAPNDMVRVKMWQGEGISESQGPVYE